MANAIAAALPTDALRGRGALDPKATTRDAAKQFEALFMQEVMKSLRQATLASGMLDNAGTQLGTEMLDAQFASQLTGLRGGLADAIARQLDRQLTPTRAAPPAGAAGFSQTNGKARQIDFIESNQSAAAAAAAETGIPAAFMLAQAAHETGWGQREIRQADGSSAHNLFGIKAGRDWTGAVAEVTTTEYVGGAAQKVTQRFRAYASAAESFRDYAQLMKGNPRYSQVLASGGSAQSFAQGLQTAGYATDPAYADKLARVINTTLRLQRMSA